MIAATVICTNHMASFPPKFSPEVLAPISNVWRDRQPALGICSLQTISECSVRLNVLFGSEGDIGGSRANVRFVPKAESRTAANRIVIRPPRRQAAKKD